MLQLYCLSKISEPYYSIAQDYQQRVKKAFQIELKIQFLSLKKNIEDKEEEKRLEAKLLLKKLSLEDYLVLFDEKGKNLSSQEFAKKINTLQIKSYKKISFVIGGNYGFAQEIKERADCLLSLSSMTFPAKIAFLLANEQVYRAISILNNHPYHK